MGCLEIETRKPIPKDHKEYDCPQNERILAVLKQAAQDLGVEVNTLVLGYLMQGHGFQVIPIVGIKSKKEMEIATIFHKNYVNNRAKS